MLTDKEIDAKLTQVGLPMHGTREQKLERLVRNGLHVVDLAPGKITEAFEAQKEVNRAKTEFVESIADVPVAVLKPEEVEVLTGPSISHDMGDGTVIATADIVRKPGRPKKGK